ncbi:hypothetical protein KGA03_000628 [Enterococcus faecium]|nr:hypothetical protein [Enterococcus faecium]
MEKEKKCLKRENILKNNRAEELRKMYGYSLRELKEKIYENKEPEISISALLNFEKRKNVLWKPVREKMAKIYNVTLSYLDGDGERL